MIGFTTKFAIMAYCVGTFHCQWVVVALVSSRGTRLSLATSAICLHSSVFTWQRILYSFI